MLRVKQVVYNAAKRLLEVMQSEQLEMYRSFVAYDVERESTRYGGNPQWRPFISVINRPDAYRGLIKRCSDEFSLSAEDGYWIATVARSIADGGELEVFS